MHCEEITQAFEACFAKSHNTILCGGFAEPEYRPSEVQGKPCTLGFREAFNAAGLHPRTPSFIEALQKHREIDTPNSVQHFKIDVL